MISPRRRTTRKEYLDASVVPVEAALTARSDVTGSHLDVARQAARAHGLMADDALVGTIAATVAVVVADELRALAEELHWH